jgi:hypothetical protein
LTDHLNDVVRDYRGIRETFTDGWGSSVVFDSLLFGPAGVLHLETTWKVTPDGLRFSTLIPYGNGKESVSLTDDTGDTGSSTKKKGRR